MSTAAEQVRAMQSALAAIEESMLAASADPGEFAKLDSRRRAMNAELARLQMRERVEQREAEQAHQTALIERRDEAKQQAAKLRAQGAELELQTLATIELLNLQLREAAELTREHRKLAGVNNHAVDALRRQFKIVGRPEVSGSWVCGEKAVLDLYGLAYAWLASSGINVEDPRALSAMQYAMQRRR